MGFCWLISLLSSCLVLVTVICFTFQAVVLCEYLEKNQDLVKDKRVVELGAGTGLVGIVAGLLGRC